MSNLEWTEMVTEKKLFLELLRSSSVAGRDGISACFSAYIPVTYTVNRNVQTAVKNKSATVTTMIKNDQNFKETFCHKGSKETFVSNISLR